MSQRHADEYLTSACVCVAIDHPYYAHSGDSGGADSYVYYLNICGEIPTNECGKAGEYISSCQVKKDTVKKVAGRYQNQTLRYGVSACVSKSVD